MNFEDTSSYNFYAGMFFGGILALMIEALLLAFAPDYLGHSAVIWIIVLDFIITIDYLFTKLQEKRRKNGTRTTARSRRANL